MDANLAKVLVQRGVIRQGTVLEAYQSARSLACVYDSYIKGSYVVVGAVSQGEWVYFDVATSSTERHRLRCDYVASVDGMAIDRVVAAHQLRQDGTSTKTTRRRSQKKKLALPYYAEAAE